MFNMFKKKKVEEQKSYAIDEITEEGSYLSTGANVAKLVAYKFMPSGLRDKLLCYLEFLDIKRNNLLASCIAVGCGKEIDNYDKQTRMLHELFNQNSIPEKDGKLIPRLECAMGVEFELYLKFVNFSDVSLVDIDWAKTLVKGEGGKNNGLV
jgi:hypothetical protein